jgi:Cu-Zn family superoxide dismutase
MKPAMDRTVIVGFAMMLMGGVALAQMAKKVELKSAKGESVGVATITANKAGGVEIALDLKALPPGEHALHFHQTAKCEGPDFTSAGGHFNPTGRSMECRIPRDLTPVT